jgi:putative tryptophan/tyrosine transport system substrate-binding protein
MIKRREFITLLGGAAAAWPMVVRGQQPAIPMIGFLSSASKATTQQNFESFLQGMRQLGYAAQRNWLIEQRYADGNSSHLPQLAQELVGLVPKVIVADSTPGTLATKRATPTIPIVGSFVGCCARAAIGHVPAAPPIRMMNSRR